MYDAKLNVSSRRDGLQNKNKNPISTEYFQYDELDRLTCGSFSSAVVCPTSDRYTYQSNGNLSTKPGIPGTYTYDPQHPHAVQKAGTDTFAYDLTGNQKTRSGAVVTYTPFDLPRTFTPAAGQGGVPVAFDYDGNQARVRKTSGTDVTVYFDDLYERTRNTVSNAVEHRYFVYSSSGLVATVTRTPAPAAQSTTRYLHLDNLGSIDAITEATGSGYSEKRSYDAFGARRNPQWGAAVGAFTSLTKRGFTGHEGDEELGLINMKGRIFDPKIGRFLTTDPIVSHPGLGQSWNPYSYVLNNPLAYVDPSGFQEATLDSAFSSCSGCVRIDGPTTVQWSVTPIGPPPPPANDPNDTPASWPVDLKPTGNAAGSPPQRLADTGGGFGGASQDPNLSNGAGGADSGARTQAALHPIDRQNQARAMTEAGHQYAVMAVLAPVRYPVVVGLIVYGVSARILPGRRLPERRRKTDRASWRELERRRWRLVWGRSGSSSDRLRPVMRGRPEWDVG